MPLDPTQSTHTAAFIQKFAADQQVSTKDGAWEVLYKAMSYPAFKPYLPDGFVPQVDNDTAPVAPVADTAPATRDSNPPTLAEMFVSIEVALRAGDNDVRAFIERLAPSQAVAAATQAAVTRSRKRPAADAADGSTSTGTRAPMDPRPVSYILSTDPNTVIPVRSWRVLYAELLGRVLAVDPASMATSPKGWFKDTDNVYNTAIPGGTGDMAYAFTCLKVDETQHRCSRLLGILGLELTVTLKDGSVVAGNRAV